MADKKIKSNNVHLLISNILFPILGIAAIVALCALLISKDIFNFKGKNLTTDGNTAKVDLLKYFNVEEDEIPVILNGLSRELTALNKDGKWYILQADVATYLNDRFYYDKTNKAVLYTTATTTYKYVPNDTKYTDMKSGEVTNLDYPVVLLEEENIYIELDYAKKIRQSFDYRIEENPTRVVIKTAFGTSGNIWASPVKADRKVAIREKEGINSKVVDMVEQDEIVYVVSSGEMFTQVVKENGCYGYLYTKYLTQVTDHNGYAWLNDPGYSNIKKDHVISLAWYQAGNGDNIDEMLSGTSVNTISPVWYQVKDIYGNVSSGASKSFVDKMHEKGIEVWPLISDFSISSTTEEFLSNIAARKKVIDKLIADATKYGYDGLNIDFEYIKYGGARHYTQFLRELSVECRANNIVLSTDNYVPMGYNNYYNRTEQGKVVDYVIIMGYDEHTSGSTQAGSVASLPYVENGIVKTMSEVELDKIINGMPFYTRIWREKADGTSEKPEIYATTDMAATMYTINSFNANIIWDEECGQYYAEYTAGAYKYKVWIEDAKSIEMKMKLAANKGVKNFAYWRLGMEDSSVWSVIEQYVK